jgi:hypothetical protein
MKKLEYLKLAIEEKRYRFISWFTRCFTLTTEVSGSGKEAPVYLEPLRFKWGYGFYNKDFELIHLEDTDPNQPLFNYKEIITVDDAWCGNIEGVIETTIGRLMLNIISISTPFNNKLPYFNKRFSVKEIESIIAKRIVSNPGVEASSLIAVTPDSIYVSEYVAFMDTLTFLEQLSILFTHAATPKNTVAPPGIIEFRNKLEAKYKGKLSDPIELAKFNKELDGYANDYLKDDPSYGKFLKGKVRDPAYKKLHMSIGVENGFNENVRQEPIVRSLSEGWTKDPREFVMQMNSIRSGSYARGAETVNGGVAAKVILRAANNFVIKDTDCGSLLGLERLYTKDTISQIVGDYLINEEQEPTLIENEEQASRYLGKVIRLRDPAFCQMEGDTLCRVCAGTRLSENPTGLAIPLTEISAVMLTASLKKMHGTVLSTAEIDIFKYFS